jgi:hypothetical protein
MAWETAAQGNTQLWTGSTRCLSMVVKGTWRTRNRPYMWINRYQVKSRMEEVTEWSTGAMGLETGSRSNSLLETSEEALISSLDLQYDYYTSFRSWNWVTTLHWYMLFAVCSTGPYTSKFSSDCPHSKTIDYKLGRKAPSC